MSFTVHEALTLPVMDSALLLAGSNGLSNEIKWVTIVEVIEDINRFQDGEFLITTGYGLNENSTHFLKLLAMKKLSGVAIYSGFYLERIPKVFIEVAHKNDLPLIELPTSLNFSTVTKSILQQIVNKQIEEENKETERRLQDEFFEEIMNQNFHSTAMILNRGKELGYNLSLPQAILQIKLEEYLENDDFKKNMELLFHHLQRVMEKEERQFIVKSRLDRLIMLSEIQATKKRSLKQDSLELAQKISESWKLKHPKTPIIIGVGRTYTHVNQISDSTNEAKYAVDLSGLLLVRKEIIHYEDLATFHLLLQMKEMGVSLQTFYEEKIGGILPVKPGVNLIETLEGYFRNNLNLQATATQLFIHRHTLKYRLNQIEKKLGCNLNSADERLALHLAIAAYKLEKYFGEGS